MVSPFAIDASLLNFTEQFLPRGRNRKRVLILCSGNSARTQMAEGLLHHLAGERFDFVSGVSPTQMTPEAIAAMREIGIDILHHRSKSVDEFGGQE